MSKIITQWWGGIWGGESPSVSPIASTHENQVAPQPHDPVTPELQDAVVPVLDLQITSAASRAEVIEVAHLAKTNEQQASLDSNNEGDESDLYTTDVETDTDHPSAELPPAHEYSDLAEFHRVALTPPGSQKQHFSFASDSSSDEEEESEEEGGHVSDNASVAALPQDGAAAASPLPMHDSENPAKTLEEDRARVIDRVSAHLEFLCTVKGKCDTSLNNIQQIMSDQDLQLYNIVDIRYKTSGTHIVRDKVSAAREKALNLKRTLITNIDDINNQLQQFAPFVPKYMAKAGQIDLLDEETTLGSSGYAKLAGATLLTALVVTGGGAAALGTLAASVAGYSLTLANIGSGAIGLLSGSYSPIILISLLGGGGVAGGVAATELKRAIEDQGGVAGLIKELKKAEDRLNKGLKNLDKNVIKVLKALKGAVDDYHDLNIMLTEHIEDASSFLWNKAVYSVSNSVEWLKNCQLKYSKLDDFATALLSYGMVNPHSIGLDDFKHSPEQLKYFGSVNAVASWLFDNENRKLDFVCNIAVHFMTLYCQEQTKEFNEAEYREWVDIASSAGLGFNIIAFDLEIASRCGREAQVLTPTIAAKKFQVQEYMRDFDAKKAQGYIDLMVQNDAKDILLADHGKIKALLAHCVKVYSKIFDETEAQKYTALLVYSILDPSSSLDIIDLFASTMQSMVNTSRCHDDINISAISTNLYQNDHAKQNELTYNVAKNLMQQRYFDEKQIWGGAWQKSGYTEGSLKRFVEHERVIEYATFIGVEPHVFAGDVMNMCRHDEEHAAAADPLVISERFGADSSAATNLVTLNDSLYVPDLLAGENYAYEEVKE